MDIVDALLELYPFRTIYIADLNAIQRQANPGNPNYPIIEQVTEYFPGVRFWLDAGIRSNSDMSIWGSLNVQLVCGSEGFTEFDDFLTLTLEQKSSWILSLDFMIDGFRGPPALLDDAHHWPEDVVVMSLPNVGANQGPNITLLERVSRLNQTSKLYSAGGVRNANDLEILKKMQVDGVLMATALHEKRISHQQLLDFQE